MLGSLILILIGVLSILFAFVKYRYTYWKRRGIPYIEPSFLIGNLNIKNREHIGLTLKRIYDQLKSQSAPFIGMFFFIKPIAVVTNLDLTKLILIKDFKYFTDRGIYYNEIDDPLSATLFSLHGPQWKTLRSKLTPTFSSGRMKLMYPTISEVGERLVNTLNRKLSVSSDVDISDLLTRFTTDIIGTCAFGIECNSLDDPEAAFHRMGGLAFIEKYPFQNVLLMIFPKLAKIFHLTVNRAEVTDFFLGILRKTVEYREQNGIKRNDFMDLLLQLKTDGYLADEGGNKIIEKLSFEELAAQAFVFFIAGFETSSTTMTFLCYEMAKNPEIQNKLRDHFEEVIKQHGGELSYDALSDMPYLDKVLNETLRRYSLAAMLFRQCVADYKIPDTNFIIEKGTIVWIPTYAIHNDSDLHPEPEKFDPERFSPSLNAARHPSSYIPFGDGPRNCIGLRFALMQVRVGMIAMLRKFRLSVSSKTPDKITFNDKNVVIAPDRNLWLKFESI